jgi:ABC-2 type transport system ATP-binding protein
MVSAGGLGYRLRRGRDILAEINFTLSPGSFLAVVGENGAGKTTLLDLLMGFRRRVRGSLSVLGRDPETDPWQARSRIAYLSEKIDMPGDWRVADFLGFHRQFYRTYNHDSERTLMERLAVRSDTRLGTMSAGENRRVQIVAALAARPELLIADEITAVLDILGRRLFLALLKERQQSMGLTTVLATNVPEGLDGFADHVLVISRGSQVVFSRIASYVPNGMSLADTIADTLTTHAPTLP